MLTITEEARTYAFERGGIIFLEYIVVQGCCIPYQPEPSVRIGKPHNPEKFCQAVLQGITVFIPRDLPEVPLVINVSTFLGFKKLVVEGWRHA
jgi:hypothetical protein